MYLYMQRRRCDEPRAARQAAAGAEPRSREVRVGGSEILFGSLEMRTLLMFDVCQG
jgi:hypothetical protein